MTPATHRLAAFVLALALASPAVVAQTLGDEFILFVDGTNVMVPQTDGLQVVNDPLAPTSGDQVARFNSGSWTHSGFAWERTEGVDATASVGATFGESDTLYVRMLSDPANAGVAGISLMISDATDDAGPSREDLESGAATADPEFRLLWQIPDELHDGAWHDLAIPLPPATNAALEEARANGELDDSPAQYWAYTGSWTQGGFGIGSLGGYDPQETDPLFEDFSWDHLYKIGPFWDIADGTPSGPIYLDDVYIGGPGTDISVASAPPAAMSNVTFAADGDANLIDWADSQEFGGYNVYASESPITDVMADGVVLLATIGFGEETELVHRYEIPHPALGATPLYYAVTSLSEFGVENRDVSMSSGEIANPNLPQKAYVTELTDAQADAVFEAVSNGTIVDPFEDGQPVFRIDSSHRSPGDGTTVATLPEDSDLSATVKMGYTSFNELVVYAEITDDAVVFAPVAEEPNTWNYDSFELSFGNYDVRDIPGGGLLQGTVDTSPGTLSRGEYAEYGIRITGLTDADTGDYERSSTWIGFSLDVSQPWSVVERTDTGWRLLSLIALDQIQADGDEFVELPGSDEILYVPLALSLNDADVATRENQIVWMTKPNVTGQWWNSSDQWETVAFAGSDVSVGVEDGSPRDGFALAQSAPNPTAGRAEIAFALPAAADVRIDVFNALGQRVATVADGRFGAGAQAVSLDTRGLAAGVYVYRMAADGYVATRRMTVVR